MVNNSNDNGDGHAFGVNICFYQRNITPGRQPVYTIHNILLLQSQTDRCESDIAYTMTCRPTIV